MYCVLRQTTDGVCTVSTSCKKNGGLYIFALQILRVLRRCVVDQVQVSFLFPFNAFLAQIVSTILMKCFETIYLVLYVVVLVTPY